MVTPLFPEKKIKNHEMPRPLSSNGLKRNISAGMSFILAIVLKKSGEFDSTKGPVNMKIQPGHWK